MHDFANLVEHFLEELPSHYKDLSHFIANLKGEKQKVRAVDARRYAIKLAIYVKTNVDKFDDKLVQLTQTLVEITDICYGYEEDRTPARVLRLHNICFTLAILTLEIVGLEPKNISGGSLYGIHFHNIVKHTPLTYRLVNLRSLLAEQDEASIYRLRMITETTSSKTPTEVIENALTRYNFVPDHSYARSPEQSVVGKEAKQVS